MYFADVIINQVSIFSRLLITNLLILQKQETCHLISPKLNHLHSKAINPFLYESEGLNQLTQDSLVQVQS